MPYATTVRQRFQRSSGRSVIALAILPLLSVVAALASPLPVLAADFHVDLDLLALDVVREGESLVGETVRLPDGVAERLATAGVGDRVHLDGFPVAPGQRADLVLEPFDVYHPEARIVAIETGRQPVEVPRSLLRHFRGRSLDGRARAGLSFDPQGGTIEGLAISDFGTVQLSAPSTADPQLLELRLARWDDGDLESSCSGEQLPPHSDTDLFPRLSPADVERIGAVRRDEAVAGGGPAFEAVIAVDTDNELMHLRFSNSTVSATNYLASLFVSLNVIYNRDLDLDLLLGDTFLRLDTDPVPTYDDDPWTVTASPANISALNEFGQFWASNMGSVDRVLAMLLSGKSSSANSSSGIAWIDGYCENQSSGGGYSVTQTFRISPNVLAAGVRLIGHELGHNFGSPHTHCYNPPVDNCYHLEGGCFSGSPVCPAAGNGTIMSYCHFSSGANCGSSRSEFHPTVINRIDNLIQAHFPGCIEQPSTNDVFSDGFESGNTLAWSVVIP